MLCEKRIDDLIEARWYVLKSDFDSRAFQNWRECAFDCLSTLLGPDHAYTLNFEEYVRRGRQEDVLAGAGVLTAAREQMANGESDDSNVPLGQLTANKRVTHRRGTMLRELYHIGS